MTVLTKGLPKALLTDLGWARSTEDILAAIDEHDLYTGGHSCRVASLASLLARLLGMTEHEVSDVRDAGLVHDLGKLGIPRELLRKYDPLTEEEVSRLRMHPILGATMVAQIPHLAHLAKVVLHHHERWDGQGYPIGLSGVDIPIEARLILAADAFDAMTSARPYGFLLGTDVALEEMQRCSGWQFDPSVVEALQTAIHNGLVEHNGVVGRIPAEPAFH